MSPTGAGLGSANMWRSQTRVAIDSAMAQTDPMIAERGAAIGRSVSSVEERLRKYHPGR